ncbi:hypothetical protein H0H92_001743 [Tricholoma furcatifolium]|nr:hypothetical protein H0H92_001743 [Tricholoma furcatifolium]
MSATAPASTPGPQSLRTWVKQPPKPPLKTRRTSEQVCIDNELKEQAKQGKISAHKNGVHAVADLETSMREEDRQNTLHAHHPPTRNVQKAV